MCEKLDATADETIAFEELSEGSGEAMFDIALGYFRYIDELVALLI